MTIDRRDQFGYEHLEPREAIFVKMGGTWDMRPTPRGLAGSGNLDDAEVTKIEQSLGWDPRLSRKRLKSIERKLAHILFDRFIKTEPESLEMQEHIREWCPNFENFAYGPFYAVYSGDSSHLRPAFTAPLVRYLLDKGLENPERALLGAQGTDTAGEEVLPMYDVLSFDMDPSDLPALKAAGSNRAWMEKNSDAPSNFEDLGKICQASRLLTQRGSGAFWVFIKHVYSAANFIKVDPSETRKIEGQDTFLSPHGIVYSVDKIFQRWEDESDIGSDQDSGVRVGLHYKRESEGHVVDDLTVDSLFSALTSVHTVDLGDQNPIWDDVKKIIDPQYQAVVVAAHSLGNSSNPIRRACIEAVKSGKLVVATSRSLIGETSDRYAGSLATINSDELKDSGEVVISSHKLSKTLARAVATRAILESLNPRETQRLFTDYCEARNLR